MKKYEECIKQRFQEARDLAEELNASFNVYEANRVPPPFCIICDHPSMYTHLKRSRTVIDLDDDNKVVVWFIKYSVFMCSSCRRSHTPVFPMTTGKGKYGLNLQAYVEELNSTTSVAAIKRKLLDELALDIPVTTLFEWVHYEKSRHVRRHN